MPGRDNDAVAIRGSPNRCPSDCRSGVLGAGSFGRAFIGGAGVLGAGSFGRAFIGGSGVLGAGPLGLRNGRPVAVSVRSGRR